MGELGGSYDSEFFYPEQKFNSTVLPLQTIN